MNQVKIDWKFFWMAFCVGIGFLALFLCPFFVGMYVGHFWGLVIASVNAIAYIWLGIRQPMASSTRAIWAVGILFVLFVAGYEWSQMSVSRSAP